MRSLNRADAVAASVFGDPPALFTAMSSRPWRSMTAPTSAST